MCAPKLAQSLANLRRALDRLGEALAQSPANALVVDGTIQRFEFAIELTWKTKRQALALEGVETTTPRSTLKQAYAAGWIDDEAAWLQMLQDRNDIAHLRRGHGAPDLRPHPPPLPGDGSGVRRPCRKERLSPTATPPMLARTDRMAKAARVP